MKKLCRAVLFFFIAMDNIPAGYVTNPRILHSDKKVTIPTLS
jgi:hypothetical protein